MKRSREEKRWFRGLKWAENLFFTDDARTAESTIDMHTDGSGDPFDQGARAYLFYRIHTIEKQKNFAYRV